MNQTCYVRERGLLAEGAQFMMMSIDYNIEEVKFSFSDLVYQDIQEVISFAFDFYFLFPLFWFHPTIPSNLMIKGQ